MPVSNVTETAKTLLALRDGERSRLELIEMYLKDPTPDRHTGRMTLNGLAVGPNAWLPAGISPDVRRLADISRVNMLRFVVDATVQVMYVDGYRSPGMPAEPGQEDPAWSVWQVNRMDARQIGVHRGSLSYGASYVSVLPGDAAPVMRGHSAMRMTVAYDASGDDWPVAAIEARRSAEKGKRLYRMLDDTNIYWLDVDDKGEPSLLSTEEHGAGVCPVVRFRPTIDDDTIGAVEGDVQPLIPLQDQINITTFGLLVAQHYGAHRQRYIMGWLAETEEQALTASARKLWTFDDPDIKVGEFGQTDLNGYIASREASLRHMATVSQTPAHELLGMLANLSAEALAAAEANHRRKVTERQTVMGEAWEQVLELGAAYSGVESDPMAYVRWKDTEARSLASAVDALGKMATMLGIPASELWERVPGVSQQEVAAWKAEKERNPDPMQTLAASVANQAAPPVG